ncbi:ABC transporter ATP-binding protein [Methylocystis sp. ATCC 49242]|uniref:ABC transporter ATP-binding protein n=1 Tax=Methylocystis sp. ATCC 49242 TaxID=622637 RepID=UPI0001F88902|nr:ABC transporter ATP-binding protein [Methylocystis sp. ATCC 49242]
MAQPPSTKLNLRALVAYAAPYRVSLLFASGVTLAETGAALVVPWLGGRFAGDMLSQGQGPVGSTLLALLAALAAQALLKFLNGYLVASVSERILADLRVRIYDHLQSLPLSFYHQRPRGDILALITREISQLSEFITGTFIAAAPTLLTIFGAILQMFSIDVLLAGLVAGLTPIFILLLKIVGRKLRPLSGELQEAEATSVAIAEENLGMLPIIKMYTREKQEGQRYRRQIYNVVRLSTLQQRIYAALDPAVQLIAASAVVLLLWVATGQMAQGSLTPAGLVSFILYSAMLSRPIGAIAGLYGRTQMARGTLERLHRVLAERPEPIALTGLTLQRVRGEIEFRGVSFHYPGRPPVLKSLDFHIRAGETIAITGHNGAGKSTLMHLLMRLYELDAGRIFIDGVDIANVDLHSLRSQIGVVPQRVLLFNSSVRANIGFGDPRAEQAAIERAARSAQAHDFISRLPAGYDTVIGDDGVRLSGGQRQRIALARALIKNPPILALDEATAMFDPQGEASLIGELRDGLAGRTVILITHRPASLALADRVVKLEGGVISTM